MRKIVVIGGGASGMTAAIAAKTENPKAEVRILEHKDITGKKLLSTGNGRCNFTNAFMKGQCFFSDAPDNIERVLQKFGTRNTLCFFEDLGIMSKSRNGYYYPQSDQASAVLRVFQMRLKTLGVLVDTNIHVRGIRKSGSGFLIMSDEKTYEADRIILACGGKAFAVSGSDGSGYGLAKSLGHTMTPVVPALVQLKVKDHPLAKASGVRTDARVCAYESGHFAAEDTGELQITGYGISGIPVFQISRHVAKALYRGNKAQVRIDFLPFMTGKEFSCFLEKRKAGRETFTMSEFLTGIFNQKLIPCLLKSAGIWEDTKVQRAGKALWDRLIDTCKSLTLGITDTNGFDNAQVCAGGIRLDEINADSMESLCCKHVYLAGEMLDVDGICGGYNLQWAWASGYLAGRNAAK